VLDGIAVNERRMQRKLFCAAAVASLIACGAPSTPVQPTPLPLEATQRASADAERPRRDTAEDAVVATFSKCDVEEDVRTAADATTAAARGGRPTGPTLADALWSCFSIFKPSKSREQRATRSLAEALFAVKAAAYGPKAIEMIARPLPSRRDLDARNVEERRRIVCLQLLADLHYVPAVRPLVTLLVTEDGEGLAGLAGLALLSTPREAEPLLVSALAGTDPEIAAVVAKNSDRTAIVHIADALGVLSRPAGQRAVLDALARETNDLRRVYLARRLGWFPSSTVTMNAYKEAYAKLPRVTSPNDLDLRGMLLRMASAFGDPTLIPWILQSVKGTDNEFATLGLHQAVLLVDASHAGAVGAAVARLDGDGEKDLFATAQPLVMRCREDARCYVQELDKPLVTQHDRESQEKAVRMAAVYGDGATKAALLAKLVAIRDRRMKEEIGSAIFHLSPAGDEAAAAVLDAGESEQQRHDGSVLHDLAMRLRARAAP
jgi:hypothetical protein